MKHSVTTLMAFIVAAILFSQCTGGKQPAETPQVTTDSDSVSTVPDSTVYGVVLESGMSAIYTKTMKKVTVIFMDMWRRATVSPLPNAKVQTVWLW